MDQQSLLSRVRDLAATSEGLDLLLGEIGATLGEERERLDADGSGPVRAEAVPLLARAREMLAASGQLVAASEAVRDVLVPSSRALAAAAREQRGMHREQVRQARAALAHSRHLLAEAGQEGTEGRPGAAAPVAPLLAKLKQHGTLPEEERAALLGAVGWARDAPAGGELVREGSSPTESTLLLDGFAARCKVLAEGERQITAIHVPGDFADLHAFLLRPVDHAVVALTRCTVAAVPHDALRRVTEAYPGLARLLWRDTLVDGAVHREWLVAMGRRSALGHLAHLVCELFLRLGAVGLAEDGPDGTRRCRLPLTQADLADALGLSVVHVNRTLRELREQGLATWKSQTLVIHDWDRLAQLAEFSPAYLGLAEVPRSRAGITQVKNLLPGLP